MQGVGKLVKIKEGGSYSFSGLKLMNSFKPSINAIVTEAVENNERYVSMIKYEFNLSYNKISCLKFLLQCDWCI